MKWPQSAYASELVLERRRRRDAGDENANTKRTLAGAASLLLDERTPARPGRVDCGATSAVLWRLHQRNQQFDPNLALI
jgi:hypothetical protein